MSDGDTNYWYCTKKGAQKFEEKTGGLRNHRKNCHYPDYSIDENSKNIQNSPGDLKRFAVTQIPEKDHQLMLLLKKHEYQNDNNNNLDYKNS